MKILNKKDFIVSILFVTIITVFFVGTVFTSAKYIAWSVLKNHYEYQTDDSLSAKVSSYVTAYESSFNDSVFIKENCIDLFGLLQNIMGKRVIPTNGFTGTIVKGNDNKLYTANSVTENDLVKDYSNDDINQYADSLIKLKSQLSLKNIKLLYVQAPQKYHSEVNVPINIDEKYLDSRVEKMLSLIENRVDYINFNEIIKDNSINKDSVFFKTDHHWTVQSAFLCYQNICSYLNENMSFNIEHELYDNDSWNVNILKNSYLGSSGVRVGSYYVGRDDFALITPNFNTSFVRKYTSTRTLTYKGDYAHSIIDNYDSLINNRIDPIWGDYCGSDTSFVSIKNLTSRNNKEILIIKDSFALPICAFMSTTCKQLDICDLRSYNSSITDTIETNKYDLIILIYNPQALSATFFNFS